MTHRNAPILLVLAMVAMTAACSPSPTANAAASPVAQIKTAPVAPLTLASTLEAYGSVGYSPKVLRMVDAPSEVMVLQVYVSIGQSVAAGDRLLSLRPTAGSMEELRKARTDLDFARAQASRTQRLFDQQLATNADRAAATQALETAQAIWASAQSRIRGEGEQALRAEVPGIVAGIDVERGDIAPADTVLIRLADTGQLQVRVGIEPSDLPRVQVGQLVSLSPVYDGQTTVDGTVTSVVAQVDPVTRLAEALVDLDAPTALLPGSTVRASIQVQRREGVLGIPRSAVLYSGDRAYAFVVEGGKARQTWIEPGQDDGDNVEIVSGLTAGQTVVVEGNYVLEDGMDVSVASPGATP